MPLQRLTMNSDYSEGSESLINPLPQKSNRNPPRAILISSSRTTANSAPQAKSIPQFSNNVIVPKNSTATTNPRNSMGNAFQRQPKSYGHFDPELMSFSKTRKFADFSVGEEVEMGREIAVTSHSHQASLESASPNIIPLDCLSLAQPTLP